MKPVEGLRRANPGVPVRNRAGQIGGAGLGAGLGSQGAIQVTPDGRYLLAVDAGSNQISVLRVSAGGVPVQVGRSPPGRGAGQHRGLPPPNRRRSRDIAGNGTAASPDPLKKDPGPEVSLLLLCSSWLSKLGGTRSTSLCDGI